MTAEYDQYDERVMDAAADCGVYPQSIIAAALDLFFEHYVDDGERGHDATIAVVNAFHRHRETGW